jgi:hypothetical protein
VSDVMDRTIEQRMAALEKANAIRFYRVTIREGLKAGRIHIVDLIATPKDKLDPRLHSLRVHHVLRWAPRLDKTGADRLHHKAQISYTKTLGGMTDRQRRALVDALEDLPRFRRAA